MAQITQSGATPPLGMVIPDDRGHSAGYRYANITGDAPTTTEVKGSGGFLHSITFNKPVASGTATIYDNTAASGTVIGTITTPTSPLPVTLIYDICFNNGLTIVTATAAQDITVAYI